MRHTFPAQSFAQIDGQSPPTGSGSLPHTGSPVVSDGPSEAVVSDGPSEAVVAGLEVVPGSVDPPVSSADPPAVPAPVADPEAEAEAVAACVVPDTVPSLPDSALLDITSSTFGPHALANQAPNIKASRFIR